MILRNGFGLLGLDRFVGVVIIVEFSDFGLDDFFGP